MKQEFEFPSAHDCVRLRGRLLAADELEPPFPTVVMLTGDGPKGTKSLSWTNIPPLLERHGIASFLFDFQGLGYSDGDRRSLSVSKGMQDLQDAMRFISDQEWADRSRLACLASSFGAAVLLLQPEIANRFSVIGLKSPAPFLPDSYVAEIGIALYDRWANTGYLEENGYDFDVLLDALRFNAYASARDIVRPCLITHGDADSVVSVMQSKYLVRCLGGPTRLEVFKDVGHGYSEGDAWQRMAEMFVDWFVQELCG